MKFWNSSFPVFVLLGYFAIILMAVVSVVADASKAMAASTPIETVPFPTTAELSAITAQGEIADLGSMTVTAYRAQGARAN